GGCQSLMDLAPDLTMLGKAIGGGFPVGALGGGRELLKIFDPADMKLFHTGTFNANPVTMAAGNVAVRELTAERIATMDALALDLKDGLIAAVKAAGLPISVNHFGSCLNIYFADRPPESSILRDDQAIMTRFHHAAMNHGLFLAPRGMIALSTINTGAHVEEALACCRAALRDVVAEIG
ncbi:MAG: aminotransferase class III-fold pyridoxal phosphate-dependent enzyme, partial [Sphingomonadales bacterium]